MDRFQPYEVLDIYKKRRLKAPNTDLYKPEKLPSNESRLYFATIGTCVLLCHIMLFLPDSQTTKTIIQSTTEISLKCCVRLGVWCLFGRPRKRKRFTQIELTFKRGDCCSDN
ncbi:hypothetical protein HELRODRAFT_190572 [Helobdella robusta]|uniref:Uncharacterized protein n=1 Tax=Helobdella robusta TaxID=6412 RepID=T1FS38_HELRO|nr:hypothetical protein HELRODRAFT_190572 [Helobdella robusta]ESO09603.1 hypothetical protein HELRODRAFT_190572 [Helobdella robusta]